MLWFEYDGPNDVKVTDPDVEMEVIRENMPPAMSYYHDDDGFAVIIWDTKVGVIEVCVFDNGRPTAWYFSAKNTAVDAWWKKISTKGENTAVAARWIRKHVKRHEVRGGVAWRTISFFVWKKCGAVMRVRRRGSALGRMRGTC